MPVIPSEIVLTHGCVATLAEEFGLALPSTVAREPVTYDAHAFAGRRESADAELARAGLLDAGAPSRELLDSLGVLCNGSVEFFGHVASTDRHYSLHVASRGQDAVFAAMANGAVKLRPARPESMLSALLAELPTVSPAGGRSVSASAEELRPLGARARATGAAPRGDARRILELFRQPRLAGGQLRAGARTGIDNRRVKSPHPVGFIDLEQGRWLTFVTDNGAGSYVTAAPGRTDAIASMLQEAQQVLQAGRR